MFETYFHFETLVDRNRTIIIMQDGDGLVLMLNHLEKKLRGFDYPQEFDIFHIGFIRDRREEVDALHGLLLADGWVTQEPHLYHGVWTFYFKAKGGFWIEVTTPTPLK